MSAVSIACRTCGLEFGFPEGAATWECPACGASHGRPKAQGDLLDKLRRANIQRAGCDYVNAEADYRRVLSDHPDEHEALWGLVLCKYGVEYVLDAKTQERRAVLHFLRRKPITEDVDFRLACARAPEAIGGQYRKEAAYIAQIQAELLKLKAEDVQYDIFLCYKGSAMSGKGHAREHDHARDLYYNLRETGYRVFFAHETLRQAAGANYEARIFHALHSAKVMLVVCSDPATLSTPWVHSEWARYLERLDAGEKCCLIPLLYDGCDPYALPDEFVKRGLQALRMDELTSLDALRANLRRNLSAAPASKATAADDTEALLPIEYALANAEWDEVDKLTAALIKKQPRCAMAYLYRMLARHHLRTEDMLRQQLFPFEEDLDWQWALRHASEQERARLKAILNESLALRRQKEEQERAAERQKQEAERQRREEAERWTALQAGFRAAAQAGNWPEAHQLAEAMIAQRPQSHMGYLKRLMSAYELVEPAQLAECEALFEQEQDWNEALARASAEDQELMRRWKKQAAERRVRIAEYRRLAEEKRLEEEKKAAERQRRAERKRLAEEKRAEEQRAAEERRQLIEEKCDAIRKLLAEKKWDEASEAAFRLPECPEKPLLRLMARHKLSGEQSFATCKASVYADGMWSDYLALEKDERKAAKLKSFMEQAEARNVKLKNIRTALWAVTLSAMLIFGMLYLQKEMPEWSGVIALGASVIAYIAYALAYYSSPYTSGGGVITFVGLLIIGGSVWAATSLSLPLWVYLTAALVLAFSVCFADRATFEEESGVLSTPAIWLMLHFAFSLLNEFYDAAWIDAVSGFIVGPLPIVILVLYAILLFSNGRKVLSVGPLAVMALFGLLLGLVLGLVLLALPTYGVVIAQNLLPDWTGVVALGASILAFVVYAFCHAADNCEGEVVLTLLSLLLIAGAVCSVIFLSIPQWGYVCAALVISLILLISSIRNLDDNLFVMLPWAIWLVLHLGCGVANHFFDAAWLDITASIIANWISGLVSLIYGGYFVYQFGDDEGWW